MIKAEEIKRLLTIEDIVNITLSLGAEIKTKNNKEIIFTSICHHKDCDGHKPKLYFYKSSATFFCYVCSESYDIFSLIQKRKKILGESCSFIDSLKYVCDFCNINTDIQPVPKVDKVDWKSCLSKYMKGEYSKKEYNIYDKAILNELEERYYAGWIEEGISIETQQKFNIKWYNYKQQIVIPVYNDKGDFIGGHVRNLDPIAIENGYKYMPFSSLSKEYNFSTGNVLYGLNVNKENIRSTKTAVIFESPKSVLMFEDIVEINNSVALFGMNLQKVKRDLLLKYNCEHFIIALDRQYESMYKEGDYCDENGNEVKLKTDEYKRYVSIINKAIKLLRNYGTVDVIMDNDKDRKLSYKASPVDYGKETWKYLYENRIKNVEYI